MEQHNLNFQADRIEMVLAAHRAPARVSGGRLSPRTIQFHLEPAARTSLGQLQSLTEELAVALGAPSVQLNRVAGRLELQVPRDAPRVVRFRDIVRRLDADDAVRRAVRVPGTALLGLDQEGIPLLLRLSSPDVTHCLIAGATGSGKTELVRTVAASLVYFQKPRDIQLALFDPQGRGLAPLASVPHLLFPLVREPAEMVMRLEKLVSEMERRERNRIARPRIVVVVDELADILQTGGEGLASLLTRLAQRGRRAGLSLIACTQKPSAQAVGSLLKANLPMRIVGRVTNPDEARVAAGVGGTGAERLMGKGDFVLVAGGQRIRFQAAYIAPEDWPLISNLHSARQVDNQQV
jgi:S-DNA-T family DNA segregation ATPase FtsK/SpoIIIE